MNDPLDTFARQPRPATPTEMVLRVQRPGQEERWVYLEMADLDEAIAITGLASREFSSPRFIGGPRLHPSEAPEAPKKRKQKQKDVQPSDEEGLL